MPLLGPGQPLRHSVPLMVQCRPWPELVHGAGFSGGTVAITSEGESHGVSSRSGQVEQVPAPPSLLQKLSKKGSFHHLLTPRTITKLCAVPNILRSCHIPRPDAGKTTLPATHRTSVVPTAVTQRHLCHIAPLPQPHLSRGSSRSCASCP